jgi:hypothetical protein
MALVEKKQKKGKPKKQPRQGKKGPGKPRYVPHNFMLQGKHHKVHQAVKMILNNSTFMKDSKTGSTLMVSDPEVQALAQSMVDMNTIYEFRLVSSTNISTSGGGVIASYENADPSGGTGSTWTATEWSAIVSLFSEVKLKLFQLWFTAVQGLTQGNQLWISSALSSLSANPTSTTQVLDNADAKLYRFASCTESNPFIHTLKGTDLNWAIVTTPNPGSYAGCPGGIQFYGDGYSAGATVGKLGIIGVYSFRSRI